MLNQPSGEVLGKCRVYFFIQYRVYPMGPCSDQSAALKNRDFGRHQGAASRIRLRCGEHVRNVAEHIPQLINGQGVPTRVVYVERDLPQVRWESGPNA